MTINLLLDKYIRCSCGLALLRSQCAFKAITIRDRIWCIVHNRWRKIRRLKYNLVCAELRSHLRSGLRRGPLWCVCEDAHKTGAVYEGVNSLLLRWICQLNIAVKLSKRYNCLKRGWQFSFINKHFNSGSFLSGCFQIFCEVSLVLSCIDFKFFALFNGYI